MKLKFALILTTVVLIIFTSITMTTIEKASALNGEDQAEAFFYAPGELLIKFSDQKESDIDTIRRATGIEDLETERVIGNEIHKIFSDKLFESAKNRTDKTKLDSQLKNVIKHLEKNDNIEFAEPNYIREAMFTPDDTFFPLQWAHTIAHAENAWDIETGTTNSPVIAVLDSGVVYDHEDLAGSMMADCTSGCPVGTGYDFVDIDSATKTYWETFYGITFIPEVDDEVRDNDPYDYYGHGTHVAGVIAAHGNNSTGIIGICPDCKIMPLRVMFTFEQGGQNRLSGLTSDIIDAIYYAADNGADVINLSLGSESYSASEEAAVNYAHNLGSLVIASAGNDGDDGNPTKYPAAYTNTISVAATAEDDSRAYYSNYGITDVAAPGGDGFVDSTIISTAPVSGPNAAPSGYSYKQGTSFAAPYVAGVAGLIKSYNPNLTNAQVRDVLINSGETITTDFPVGPRVNAQHALEYIPTQGEFFPDVPIDHIFGHQIYALRDAGVINGFGDGSFKPNNNVIRSHMARFIKSGFDIPTNTSCEGFSDVAPGSLFYEEITTLKCEGIIVGYADGTYKPNGFVTRGTSMVYIINAARIKESGFLDTSFLPNTAGEVFPDVPSNHIFYDQIMSGYSNGIIDGYLDGEYKPTNKVRRGALSKMIDNTSQFLTAP